MAFDIERFKSEHGARNGLLRNNKFKVMVTEPPGMVGNNSDVARSLEFWCAGVQIPGYQLMTHDVRRYTYGTNEARPFAPNFEPIQLLFQADGNGEVLDFWHDWMSFIMPHDMQGGLNENGTYLLKYPDDYVVDIQITYYRETGEEVKSVAIRRAFPININSVPLSWSEQNNFVTFTVFIDFLDWYVVSSASGSVAAQTTQNNTTPPLPTQRP